jgi:hypothetical protein
MCYDPEQKLWYLYFILSSAALGPYKFVVAATYPLFERFYAQAEELFWIFVCLDVSVVLRIICEPEGSYWGLENVIT